MARYERDYGREPEQRWLSGLNHPGGWRGGDRFAPEFSERSNRFDQAYNPSNDHFEQEFDWPRGRSGFGGYPSGPGGGYRAGSTGRGDFDGYGGRYRGRENSGYFDAWQDQQRGDMDRGYSREGGNERNRARAAEIMTENPHVVTPDATIAEVAQKMRDLDVGIIPVVESTENRRLRGVITDRDITLRAVAEGKDGNAKVSECMTDRVRAVNKNDSIQEVMWVMRREQVRRVPVTDREGRLVGIIAQADLAVDYASDDAGRESEVGETLERISEPARPAQRGRMSASSGDETGRGQLDSDQGNEDRPRGRPM